MQVTCQPADCRPESQGPPAPSCPSGPQAPGGEKRLGGPTSTGITTEHASRQMQSSADDEVAIQSVSQPPPRLAGMCQDPGGDGGNPCSLLHAPRSGEHAHELLTQAGRMTRSTTDRGMGGPWTDDSKPSSACLLKPTAIQR